MTFSLQQRNVAHHTSYAQHRAHSRTPAYSFGGQQFGIHLTSNPIRIRSSTTSIAGISLFSQVLIAFVCNF